MTTNAEKIAAILEEASKDSFFEEHEEDFMVTPLAGGEEVLAGHVSPFGITLYNYDENGTVQKVNILPDNIAWLESAIHKHKTARVLQNGRKKQEEREKAEKEDKEGLKEVKDQQVKLLVRDLDIAKKDKADSIKEEAKKILSEENDY